MVYYAVVSRSLRNLHGFIQFFTIVWGTWSSSSVSPNGWYNGRVVGTTQHCFWSVNRWVRSRILDCAGQSSCENMWRNRRRLPQRFWKLPRWYVMIDDASSKYGISALMDVESTFIEYIEQHSWKHWVHEIYSSSKTTSLIFWFMSLSVNPRLQRRNCCPEIFCTLESGDARRTVANDCWYSFKQRIKSEISAEDSL